MESLHFSFFGSLLKEGNNSYHVVVGEQTKGLFMSLFSPFSLCDERLSEGRFIPNFKKSFSGKTPILLPNQDVFSTPILEEYPSLFSEIEKESFWYSDAKREIREKVISLLLYEATRMYIEGGHSLCPDCIGFLFQEDMRGFSNFLKKTGIL